jgi:translation initiation factor 1A
MVKNQNGGNKGKKVARKDNAPVNKKVRLMSEDCEIYAVVTKMLGNSQCHVYCLDGIIRLCIIRKKFTGKHKHQHLLKPGSWVLIGLRDWETKNKDKIDKCDLLECYNEADKHIICQQSNVNVEILTLEEKKIEGNEIEENNDIVFTDEIEENNDIVFTDEIDIEDI